MESNLQGALKKVAEALHRAIARSEDVEEALQGVKNEGFQAYLVLEVTVALSKIGPEGLPAEEPTGLLTGASAPADATATEPPPSWHVELSASGSDRGAGGGDAALERLTLHIAPDDQEFLRSIRIRLDE